MSKLVVNFYANVSEATARDFINWVYQQLAKQNPQDPVDELIIQISSSGGSSDHGMLLYNFLSSLSIKKTTIGMGNVDSAAVMIFAAGNNRISTPSCRFVLHEARATINGEFNSTKLSELANITKRITQDYVNVVANVTGKRKVSIANKVKAGVVLSADEAKRLGLVSEVSASPSFEMGPGMHLFIINNPQQQPIPQMLPIIQPNMPNPPLGLPPSAPPPNQNNPQILI